MLPNPKNVKFLDIPARRLFGRTNESVYRSQLKRRTAPLFRSLYSGPMTA